MTDCSVLTNKFSDCGRVLLLDDACVEMCAENSEKWAPYLLIPTSAHSLTVDVINGDDGAKRKKRDDAAQNLITKFFPSLFFQFDKTMRDDGSSGVEERVYQPEQPTVMVTTNLVQSPSPFDVTAIESLTAPSVGLTTFLGATARETQEDAEGTIWGLIREFGPVRTVWLRLEFAPHKLNEATQNALSVISDDVATNKFRIVMRDKAGTPVWTADATLHSLNNYVPSRQNDNLFEFRLFKSTSSHAKRHGNFDAATLRRMEARERAEHPECSPCASLEPELSAFSETDVDNFRFAFTLPKGTVLYHCTKQSVGTVRGRTFFERGMAPNVPAYFSLDPALAIRQDFCQPSYYDHHVELEPGFRVGEQDAPGTALAYRLRKDVRVWDLRYDIHHAKRVTKSYWRKFLFQEKGMKFHRDDFVFLCLAKAVGLSGFIGYASPDFTSDFVEGKDVPEELEEMWRDARLDVGGDDAIPPEIVLRCIPRDSMELVATLPLQRDEPRRRDAYDTDLDDSSVDSDTDDMNYGVDDSVRSKKDIWRLLFKQISKQ